jgi:hypothetical protein
MCLHAMSLFRLNSHMLSDYTRALKKRPTCASQTGFKGEITFASPRGVDTTTISLWENKNDANNCSAHTYPQMLKTLAKFIEGTPEVHTFDVVTSTFQKQMVQLQLSKYPDSFGLTRRNNIRLVGPKASRIALPTADGYGSHKRESFLTGLR